jgi:hypothetical protein
MLPISQGCLSNRVANPGERRLGKSQIKTRLEVAISERLEWDTLQPTSIQSDVMSAKLAFWTGHDLQPTP